MILIFHDIIAFEFHFTHFTLSDSISPVLDLFFILDPFFDCVSEHSPKVSSDHEADYGVLRTGFVACAIYVHNNVDDPPRGNHKNIHTVHAVSMSPTKVTTPYGE